MFDVSNLQVSTLDKVQPGQFVCFQNETDWRFCFEYTGSGETNRYLLDLNVITKGYHCSGFSSKKIEGEGDRYVLILSAFSFHAEMNSLNFNVALEKIIGADCVLVTGNGPAFITLTQNTERPIAIGRNGKVIDCPDAPVAQFKRWQIRAGVGDDIGDVIFSWPVE